MIVTSYTLKAVEEYKKALLKDLVKQLTIEQLVFYNKLFPQGPSGEQFVTAVGLLERTIKKNEAKD